MTDAGIRDAGPAPDAAVDAAVVVDSGAADSGQLDAGSSDAGDAGTTTQIGQRCQFDVNCASGICIETKSLGTVCSTTCNADCPVGWGCRVIDRGNGNMAAVCYPAGDIYCVRCDRNEQCPSAGDRCTSVGGATYCTQDCTNRACAFGFDCRDVNPDGRIVNRDAGVEPDTDGGVVKQCIPVSGLCPGCIDPDSDRYGIGADCLGKDCDETNPAIHEGATEVCDGVDNNCDGRTDEGFDLQSSIDNCGACNVRCSNAHGQTQCVAAHCVPTCAQGFWDCDGNPNNGCETALASVQFCGTCAADANCPAAFFCNQGTCEKKRTAGATCQNANECASDFCVDGVCCNEACAGTCRACNLAGRQGTCSFIAVGDDPDNECSDDGAATCGRDGACDGQGACRKYAAAIECAPATCAGTTATEKKTCDGTGVCGPAQPATTDCSPYRCDATACRTSCTTDAHCVSTHQCVSGSCKLRAGEQCVNNSQCSTGFCVDGLCCNTECNGACRSCALAGALGVCTPYAAGADPENECAADSATTCGLDGACDGAGACRKWTSGTECSAQTCSGSTQTNKRNCDGLGACLPGQATTTSCAPYVCNGSACRANCTTDAHCVSTHQCVGGICKSKQSQSCTSPSQCASGYCVDGYCCNNACTGACRSCAIAGSEGVCSNHTAGTDPENNCTASGASTCGLDGQCDGNGACRKWAAQTECAAASCSGSILTEARKCDGAGTCNPAQATTVDCAPFNCESGACRTSCTSDSHCVATHQCIAGACKLRTGQTCTNSAQCATGFCADGVCCDSSCSGTCRSCNQAGKVGTCSSYAAGGDPEGECAAESTSTCGLDGFCDGNGGCRKYQSGTVCQAQTCTGSTRTNARNCDGLGTCNPSQATTTSCGAYKCNAQGTDCLTACSTSTDCVTGYQCASGACKLSSGLGCSVDGDCASGFCTDGVCCNARCNGACQACNAAGSVGTCSNYAAGTDPEAECSDQGAASCGTNGFCDGQGACQKYTSGTTCVDETCTGGTWTYAKLCNGSGTCQTNNPVSQSCAPYTCNATAKSCLATCTSDSQCVSGYGCVSGICKKKQGQSCSSGTECASGICADNVCCNMDCSGACRACNKAGSVGTCTFHADGSDPESECASSAASTCGQDGMCNGAGACRKWASGTECLAQSCAAAVRTNQRTCDGTGTCNAANPSTTSCAPYQCNATGTDCRSTCTADPDCVAGYTCAGGSCKKAQGQSCNAATECASGFCADGYCCNNACSGTCQSCSVSGAQGTCTNYAAGSDPESECAATAASTCGTTGQCNGAGACEKWSSSTVCAAESCSGTTHTLTRFCDGSGTCKTNSPATESCGAFACGATACKTSCAADTDCASGYYCAGSACVPKKTNGATCGATNECASGFCADGVCCNSSCAGSCRSCAVTGAVGTCTNYAAGSDPESECAATSVSTCGNDGMCDGAGACRKWSNGTECAAESCSGTTHTFQRTCDGSGTCKTNSPTTESCGAYVCGATACKTGCTTDTDCSSGNYCSGGACVAKKANGGACGGGNQCTSGICADGVCCNSTCTGTCRSCNVAGSVGTCTNYSAGTDPESECAATSSTTCGADGSCNGSGTCRYWSASTTCVAESCSNSVHTFTRYCNGSGTCSVNNPATESCGAYTCNGSTCRTSCSLDSHCISGYYCGGGICKAKVANGGYCSGSNQCQSGSCCSNTCVNLQTDANNCGACGTVCSNAHGSTTCSAGACSPTCSSGWYDMDGNKNNGCECSQGYYEGNNTCGAAYYLGALNQGYSTTVSSRLVPSKDSDWFSVYLIDDTDVIFSDYFGARFRLEGLPSGVDYDLFVYRGTCPGTYACNTDADCAGSPDLESCRGGKCVVSATYCYNNWSYCKYSRNGSGVNECIQGYNGTPGSDDSGTFYVEVRWYYVTVSSCFDYQLVVENTQAACY